MTARPYHSASSAKLGARCQRAWAYLYREGRRDPDVAWEDVTSDTAPRLRSLALGKAVHACGEAHYAGDTFEQHTLPGQVFVSGLAWLPRPSACARIEIERAIGDVETGFVRPRPTHVRVVHGVRFGGFRDLAVVRREGASWPAGLPDVAQIDYKTTASISRYALDSAGLAKDVQCSLYAVDWCLRHGVDAVASRWIYKETKRVRRSLAVDAIVRLDDALAVLEPVAALCRELDEIDDVEHAEANTEACYDYGGCPYHATQGGPCTATRSLRAFFAAEGKKTMPLDPNMLAKFQTAPVPAPPAPAEAPPPPPPAPAEAHPPPPPAPAEATPAPARRGRPPKSAPVAAAPPPEGIAATIAALSAELTAAEAAVATAIAARDAIVARIAEAVSS